jgi:hypothetical protein
MNKLGIIFAFGLGAAAGSVVTWQVLKKKYIQELQEEVEAYREVYSNRYDGPQQSDEEPCSDDDTEGMSVEDAEFNQLLKRYDKGAVNKEDEEYDRKPYVIPPEEFDTITGYDIVSYTYYADGVLVDDDENVVTDIDERIGSDALKTFGMYEDDSVFVRNEKLKIDYEILADTRKFSDVVKER